MPGLDLNPSTSHHLFLTLEEALTTEAEPLGLSGTEFENYHEKHLFSRMRCTFMWKNQKVELSLMLIQALLISGKKSETY